MALPKANRLQRRQDFAAVFREGIRRSGPHLTIRVLRAKSELGNTPPTRIGISISLKVSKKAVIRNRLKRQLRAALQQLLLRLGSGWLIVVVVQPSATQCDYQQFLQELEQLLAEAEVLNGYT